MEILAQMPCTFVRRLRELRKLQLEAQNNGGVNNQQIPPTRPIPNPGLDNTAIEDLIDELS